ncbi:MAG: tetratricopeptide repeat protein [Gemmatimonadaceae bacterium]|nr:tetratricopeptide repeat protein [Gemmatimonadaceae bacterium]
MLVLTSADRDGSLYPDALNLLGLALSMIGRPEDGLKAFDRALAGNPRYIEAHLNRAVVLQQLGDSEGAQQAFWTAEELGQPDASGFPVMVANRLANSHAALADEYREAGALGQAVEQYRAALALRPGFADIQYRLGRVLLEMGDHAAADRALAQALELRPGWLDGMLLRGMAMYLQGDLDGAAALWDDASARHPGEARLEVYRSMLARRRAGQS